MKNGQLTAAYNVQMPTENQFILFYTIHQRPTDTRCFIPHLEQLAASSLLMPKTVIPDAGYGLIRHPLLLCLEKVHAAYGSWQYPTFY